MEYDYIYIVINKTENPILLQFNDELDVTFEPDLPVKMKMDNDNQEDMVFHYRLSNHPSLKVQEYEEWRNE